jgi:hypothetical protein
VSSEGKFLGRIFEWTDEVLFYPDTGREAWTMWVPNAAHDPASASWCRLCGFLAGMHYSGCPDDGIEALLAAGPPDEEDEDDNSIIGAPA